MIDVLTASDVRRQDAACEGRIGELMEAAGFAVARAVRSAFGVTYGLRVVVVCGTGNNGADGLVAGRWLCTWGSQVTAVFPLGPFAQGSPGAAQLARFPGTISVSLDRALERADVVVDALFGIGLSRAPSGAAAQAVRSMNASDAPVVSVDVPSGFDADTGGAPGEVVHANGIVTFGGLKAGLCFAADVAAWIETADIGVPAEERYGAASALEEADVRALLPTRGAEAHKRGSGVVLVVAGSRAMPGAAALCTAAAVHGGAGLTTLAASERICSIVVSRVPEITTIPLPENSEGTLDLKSAEAIVARSGDFDVIALGPGLSRHPAAAEAIRAIVEQTHAPLVLDADGINAYEGTPEPLRSREGFLVVTPHEGEAARLLGRSAESIRGDRLAAAKQLAERIGHAVLLKGPGTVITAPDSGVFVNLTGDRGLAQGGTGDVLTGLTAALLAQAGHNASSIERLTMVAVAAWLHGRAAEILAERISPHPANASALIDTLAEAIAGLYR